MAYSIKVIDHCEYTRNVGAFDADDNNRYQLPSQNRNSKCKSVFLNQTLNSRSSCRANSNSPRKPPPRWPN